MARVQVQRRSIAPLLRAIAALAAIALSCVWLAVNVAVRPGFSFTREVSTPPPATGTAPGVPVVDDSGAVVFRVGGKPDAYLAISRSPAHATTGHLPTGMLRNAHVVACLHCPDSVLILRGTRLSVLRLTPTPEIVPYTQHQYVRDTGTQPVVLILRDEAGRYYAEAVAGSAREVPLDTGGADLRHVSAITKASGDGTRIVSAFWPNALDIGELRVDLIDATARRTTSFTLDMDPAVPANAANYTACLDRSGKDYAIVVPSGTTLVATVGVFGKRPVERIPLPLDASSHIEGCAFSAGSFVAVGGAAGQPDQFEVVVVNSRRSARSIVPRGVSVTQIGTLAVCDAAGIATETDDNAVRVFDLVHLRVQVRPGIIGSGCTPNGHAYFIGAGGFSWQ